MKCTGWGRYPVVDASLDHPQTLQECKESVLRNPQILARGMGRSYGDSSLAPHLLSSNYLSHFKHFDAQTGMLTCESGVSLANIIDIFLPQGWFLPVTAGTRFVTIGGAIASDIHGKNHHLNGAFSQYVKRMNVMLGNADIVEISSTLHSDLFQATCGGMGLTGLILDASIQLMPIQSSNILETTLKIRNLEELFDALEVNQSASYSVAWIDCLAKGPALGRSLLILGEHAVDGILEIRNENTINIPFDAPSQLLNHYSIKFFNEFYYHKIRGYRNKKTVHCIPYFYPLDKINNWNRLYGRNGFIQYQFVLPKEARASLKNILERIANSGKSAFLGVLKAFGPANENYLSFPMQGYTLALDFRLEPGLFKLLDELDAIILHEGGRLYLTKDARMSEHMFKKSYPNWSKFESVRIKYHSVGKFSSIQSQRLGLQ